MCMKAVLEKSEKEDSYPSEGISSTGNRSRKELEAHSMLSVTSLKSPRAWPFKMSNQQNFLLETSHILWKKMGDFEKNFPHRSRECLWFLREFPGHGPSNGISSLNLLSATRNTDPAGVFERKYVWLLSPQDTLLLPQLPIHLKVPPQSPAKHLHDHLQLLLFTWAQEL